MASVILPSGLEVELRTPNYGQEVWASSIGLDHGTEEFTYARFAVICPSMTRPQIAALGRRDGRALYAAMKQIWDGDE